MPRNEVLVDGVRLTREQIERAQRELDAPEPLRPGDRLISEKYPNDEFVVLGRGGQVALRKEYRQPVEEDGKHVWVVDVKTGAVTWASTEYWDANYQRRAA